MLQYKGYTGHADYDDKAKLFHGEIAINSDIITFQAKSIDELENAFQDSVNDYLAWCEEREEKTRADFSR